MMRANNALALIVASDPKREGYGNAFWADKTGHLVLLQVTRKEKGMATPQFKGKTWALIQRLPDFFCRYIISYPVKILD
jgi:hypothetical protein